jgi:hypothetical protein
MLASTVRSASLAGFRTPAAAAAVRLGNNRMPDPHGTLQLRVDRGVLVDLAATFLTLASRLLCPVV